MMYTPRAKGMCINRFLPTLRHLTDSYHGNRVVLCNWLFRSNMFYNKDGFVATFAHCGSNCKSAKRSSYFWHY